MLMISLEMLTMSLFHRDIFSLLNINFIFLCIIMKKFFDLLPYYLFIFVVFHGTVYLIIYTLLYWSKAEQLAIQDFEKNIWLKIEQLTEKYHVNKDQILEQYNLIKFNDQILRDEISNAVNKHQ